MHPDLSQSAHGDDEAEPSLANELDEEIKREKLKEIQSRNRKADEEEAARSGRYCLAAHVRSAMNRFARDLMSVFEGAIVELASKVAARHGVDAREEEFAMRADFHVYRTEIAARAAKRARELPELVPDQPS